MTYKKAHFVNCRFNPFDDINIEMDEKLAKYIVCLYDPGSPLIKGEQNLMRRKEVAMEIAGIESLAEYEAELLPSVQNYLQEYAKNMEWAMLIGLEETFWEYMARLRQPITDEKDTDNMRAMVAKTGLAKDAKDILDMYRSELSRFYGGDEKLVTQTGKIKQFRPEDVAKAGVNV